MSIVKRNSDWFVPSTIDGFFDRFLNESYEDNSSSFAPRVDVAETEKGFEIDLAVPGFNKKDFNIELKSGLLTISGERKFEAKKDEKNFHAIQTQYGTFRKSFQLPDNMVDKSIEATYENGILNVFIPKDVTKKLESKITVK